MQSRVDLHVHSKYSDRPSEWLLRRIGAPESFVEPLELYRKARAAGMDFVTISDHNCISGALEIAHLPGTFISNEVTAYFPEDRCKIHCLVCGITEEQFRMIEELRTDIYELRDYFVSEDIVYSVAHPFFTVNGKLTPDHVEKLLLLFDRFEGLNGSRDRRASDLVNAVFRNLTPEWIERAAERHGITPLGEEPWRKVFTGGSDDHSGLYIGSAFTTTCAVETVGDYLEQLRLGRHELGGDAGSSLRLAHSFYEIGYRYYKSRFENNSRYSHDLLGEVFENLLAPSDGRSAPPEAPRNGSRVGQRLRGMIGQVSLRRRYSETERQILAELAQLAKEGPRGDASEPAGSGLSEADQTFHLAGRLAHLAGFGLMQKFARSASEGRLVDALQTLAALGPVALGIAPYLASFATQHKDEEFLRDISDHFEWVREFRHRGARRCWLTDTFQDVNGVARMIQILGATAHEKGRELQVVTCEEESVVYPWRKNFPPVGSFTVPEYEMQQVSFPPFLDILRHLETLNCREIIVSTPGPMGLIGVLAAKLLGIRCVGIYHTDFPAYVEAMTENAGLASLTTQYMSWFYDQLDLIYTPSRAYKEILLELGFCESRLATLRRGVDNRRFTPEKRSETFWRRFSECGRTLRLLYVGRVSEEKNLSYLIDEMDRLESGAEVELMIVGDGPARSALEARSAGRRVTFTGFLEGEALAIAYASADLFVFPSLTDTFGNVVLEAQASGLPAIVSDRGGPQELITPERSGVVIDARTPGALADVVLGLARDRNLLGAMSVAARERASAFSWDRVLDDLWLSCSDLERVEESATDPMAGVALAASSSQLVSAGATR